MATATCPRCKTQYTIPASQRHSKLRCGECGREFHAGGTKAARAQRKGNQTVGWIVGGLGGILVLVVLFRFLASADISDIGAGDAPRKATSEPTYAASVVLSPDLAEADLRKHPALRRFRYFCTALRNRNHRALPGFFDAAARYEESRSPDDSLWTALPSDRREDWLAGFVDEVLHDDDLHQLARNEPVEIVRTEGPGDLSVELRFAPDSGLVPWRIAFLDHAEGWLILSYAAAPVLAEPEPEQELTREEKLAKQDAEKYIRREDGAQLLRGKIAPVPFPEGVPAAEQTRLAASVSEFLAGDGLARRRGRASLVEAGPHALPAILTHLSRLSLDDREQLFDIVALNALLESLTSRSSTFPMEGATTITDPTELADRRREAVESWYGWWAYWGSRWGDWKSQVEEQNRAMFGTPESNP